MTVRPDAPRSGPCRRRGWLLGAILPLSLAAAPASGAGGDPAYGEYLAGQCFTCHKSAGHAEGGVPAIVGLHPETFVEALLAYKSGERDNQVMRNVTGALGLEEIAALAAYFGSLSPD